MITTKQRAFLRSAANSIEPTVQIGKAGVTETVLTTVSNALDAHEIIKRTVLEACPESGVGYTVEFRYSRDPIHPPFISSTAPVI